jgi:hypothetical protein
VYPILQISARILAYEVIKDEMRRREAEGQKLMAFPEAAASNVAPSPIAICKHKRKSE